MNEFSLDIKNLAFKYLRQSQMLFSNLNLKVAVGERFGLFGPNGAGKTTLMHLMTGLLKYDQGSIQLLGKEVKNNKRKVNRLFGFVPQHFSFYDELSPDENLQFFGAWSGLDRAEIKTKTDELLEILGLEDVRSKPVHRFSGGMKRRVNLAIGVLHEPPILFLDEPTAGVDAHSRYAIMEYLLKLNEKGTTLIYTSHQLNEAEGLCEKIAMIDNGKIIAHDNLGNLLSEHRQDGLEGLFLQLTGKDFRDEYV